MKRIAAWTLGVFLGLSGTLFAGEMRTIELSDGSVVSGEILSLTNGIYTIRTDAMGTVTVPDSKIRAIRARDAAGSSSANPSSATAADIKSLTDKMTADQDIMSMIESLKDDPEFRAILQDPEIMTAIQNNDIGSLMTNQKFLNIMNNATVKSIQQKVAK